jgi:AraC-like DNA-binding protein
MRWSLSEFLNLVELRGQTWCFVSLGAASGFQVPHDDAIYFYSLLDGHACIAGVGGRALELRAGDIAMILSGEAHALRNETQAETSALEFLISGEYADAPADIDVGEGPAATRLVAGRLKVRWPGGQHPRTIPPVLQARASGGLVDFAALVEKASGGGGTAVLTRAATLMFVDAFRDHPQCRAAFQEFSLHDPISRAQQYIETHPFIAWSVEVLARKVGMGRSNFALRFAREVGRTPMEYLSDERMRHAALFLEKTDMKVAEIGERVGYRSEAAFIRRFTSRFGVSPGELRRRSQLPARGAAGEARAFLRAS